MRAICLITATFLLSLVSCRDTSTNLKPNQPVVEQKTPPEVIKEIRDTRAAGKLDQALAMIEKALKIDRKNGELWGEKGHIGYIKATKHGAGSSFEAKLDLEKAVALKSPRAEHYLLFAKLQEKDDRLLEASIQAERALQLNPDNKVKGAANLLLGKFANRDFAKLMGDPNSSLDKKNNLLKKTLQHLNLAAEHAPDQSDTWIYLANTWAWSRDWAKEKENLVKGTRLLPGSINMLDYTLNRLQEKGEHTFAVELLTELVSKKNGSAETFWFLARAEADVTDKQRMENKNPGPANLEEWIKAYYQAIGNWEKAKELNDDFEENSNKSIAFTLLSTAQLHTSLVRFDKARAELARAFQCYRGVFNETNKFGATYANLVGELGQRLLGGARGFLTADPEGGGKRITANPQDYLRKAISFFEELIGRHEKPQYIGFWYNNIGLAYRDLGSMLAGGKTKGRFGEPMPDAARVAFGKSFTAYCKAMEIHYRDPRIINDCAVILIYHLAKDLDRAEKMLLAARKAGLELYEEEKNTMDENRRFFLEEALGDSWYNQAVLEFYYRKNKKKAAAHCLEAEKYLPRKNEPGIEYPWGIEPKSANKKEKEGKQARLTPAHHFHYALVQDKPKPIDKVKKLLEEAQNNLAKNDPESAISYYIEAGELAEELLAKSSNPGLINYLLAQSDYGMVMAEKRKLQPNGLLIGDNLNLAAQHLNAALKADNSRLPAWTMLITIHLEQGNTKAAAEAGAKAAKILTEQPKADPEERAQTAANAGHALYLAFATQKAADRNSKPGPDAAMAEQLLHGLYQQGLAHKGRIKGVGYPKLIVLDLARLHAWKGDTPKGVHILGRWIDVAGQGGGLLGDLFNLGRAQAPQALVEEVQLLAAKRPDDATLLWYLGAALSEAGDRARIKKNHDQASADYKKAITSMRQVIKLNPGFKQNSQVYIIRSLAGQGWVARSKGKTGSAGKFFLAALRENPQMRKTKDSLQQSPESGISILADDLRNNRKYPEAIKLYKQALEIFPGQVAWANNMGLFARDYGTARGGEKYFKLSLWAYRLALACEPENPRLLNDTALIMIYHVREEMPKALAMLEKAVKQGKQQMKKLRKTDYDARQQLDEAIGDAWQNQGVFFLLQKKPALLPRAEHSFRQSLTHYPYKRRGTVTRHLRNIAMFKKQIAAKRKQEEEEKKRKEQQKEAEGEK